MSAATAKRRNELVVNIVDPFKGWDRLTQSVGLHPRGGVDGVAEEAVARHLDADHPGAAGACRGKKVM